MKRMLALLFTVALLLITAHRLPAPIQEVPESPTPAPTVAPTAKPKSKRVIDSKTNPETIPSRAVSTPIPAPSQKFAGTWSGIMPEVPWGNVPTELIVDQNETAMEWRETGKPKAGIAKATLTGDTLSARFPTGMTTAVWYISPQSDGVTASVRLTAFMNDQTAIFKRTSAASAAAATSKPTATGISQAAVIPVAKAVPGRPGFVYNPFDARTTGILDVRGKASGMKVKDPTSGKLFIVP